MRPEEADRWTNEVLDEVLAALAASRQVRETLVFKGAKVLAMRLGCGRQSMDIDCNLRKSALEEAASLEELETQLKTMIGEAVREHFAEQQVIKYELTSIRIRKNPKNKKHPAGLDGFKVRLAVLDRSKPEVRGLPSIRIDVAAPEELGEKSVAELEIKGHTVIAYSERRLIGEKLRAFLSSLPEFRRKTSRMKAHGRRVERIRVKDIVDIAVAERVYPYDENEDFWGAVIEEFVIACRSRGVDCHGLLSFEQKLEDTREQYEADEGLQSLIEFDTAWSVIRRLCKRMAAEGIVPFSSEFPPTME